jgi:hypothetical protein
MLHAYTWFNISVLDEYTCEYVWNGLLDASPPGEWHAAQFALIIPDTSLP